MSGPARGLAQDVTRRYITMVLAVFSLLVMTTVAFVAPLPYSTLQPGPVHDTLSDYEGTEMIEFGEDVETYDTDGTLFLTTAMVSSVDADLRLPQAVVTFMRPHSVLVPSEMLNPLDQTAEESREMGQLDMERSQANAEVAGVRAAGFDVGETPIVASTVPDGPSDGVLQSGDELTAVDGAEIESIESFIGRVSMVDAGDEVTIGFTRDDDEQEATITTTEDPEEAGRPIIGIQVGADFDMPVDVDNNLGQVIGGASAGVVFALAIYDRLTPDSLTGGLRVAGTGEIAADGTVGAIGGIRQKLAGASSADVQVFVAPQANCDDVAAAPEFDLVVLGVENLDEAITGLETLSEAGADASAEALRDRAEEASLSLCR